MNIENIFAGLPRGRAAARFFVPLGILLAVFGILLFGWSADTFVETTGKITAVTEVAILSAEENQLPQFDVDFTYTADGRAYDGTFANLTGSFTVGDDIKVYYDPENPQNITNAKMGKWLAPVLIALGGASFAFGVCQTVAVFKKNKAQSGVE